MGPWWIARGIDEFLVELAEITTERLQHMLQELSPLERTTVAAQLQAARLRLVETLAQKFDLLRHTPYLAIGIFFCCCGGDVEMCYKLLDKCILEYDAGLAA